MRERFSDSTEPLDRIKKVLGVAPARSPLFPHFVQRTSHTRILYTQKSSQQRNLTHLTAFLIGWRGSARNCQKSYRQLLYHCSSDTEPCIFELRGFVVLRSRFRLLLLSGPLVPADASMGLAAASVFVLKAVAAWIGLQWVLQMVGERIPVVKPVVAVMRVVDDFALVAGTTLCALLVLLPSFVFVVLEVFRYIQVRSHARPAKTVADYMERMVEIINELDTMGNRMRGAALRLNMSEAETIVRSCAVVVLRN